MATRTPKVAAKKSAPATRAGRRAARLAAPKKVAPKRAAKVAPKSGPGPSKETLAFAAKVVALRDAKGLAWSEVAAKLGVAYTENGSSRLRRAYTLGGGRTVGVRKNAR